MATGTPGRFKARPGATWPPSILRDKPPFGDNAQRLPAPPPGKDHPPLPGERIPSAVSRPRSICATSSKSCSARCSPAKSAAVKYLRSELLTTGDRSPSGRVVAEAARPPAPKLVAGRCRDRRRREADRRSGLGLAGGRVTRSSVTALLSGGSPSASRIGWRYRKQKRIVVLPLENLGPADHAYFAAGVTDEITSPGLASVSALQVISRTTALQYDRSAKTDPGDRQRPGGRLSARRHGALGHS